MKTDSPFYGHCAAVLKKSALFSELDTQTLDSMLGAYRRETWPKNAVLPNERMQSLFTVIISGRIELTRINPQTGRTIALFHLSAGDAFDIITLLDGLEHDVNPVALEPLEIITAPIGVARRWIESNPAFNSAFLPYLSGKIRSLEDLSADLALYETVTRLGKLILHQATPEVEPHGPAAMRPSLINTLSDEAMARMIGSVRVVVNRHIQDFKQMGLITTSHGQLVVNDLEKLREYCEKALAK